MALKDKDVKAVHKDPLDELIERTLTAFGTNMGAARAVAGTGRDEVITRMSEMGLERKSTIRRSTLRKYDGYKPSNPKTPNPDLKTICKLAHALNVPPAFLLMTHDDWRRLINAIIDMQNNVQNRKESDFVKASLKSNKVTAGLQLTKRLNIYPDSREGSADVDYQTWEATEQDINRRNDLKRQSILAMTAIAQNFETAVVGTNSTKPREEFLAILTTLAAIFGASVKTN
jgi:transcriptional regulator with XRE-family HTH domain